MRNPVEDPMDQKPKILFLNHSAQLGGAELSLIDLVSPYKEAATVLLFEDGILRKKLEELPISVQVMSINLSRIRRQSGILPSFLLLLGLIRLIVATGKSAKKFDVLYANTLKAAVVALLSGLLIGRPVIVHLRDILSPEHFSRFNILMFVWLSNCLAKRVIANSNATAQAYLRCGGTASKVTTVYNGFDFSEGRVLDQSQSLQLREQLGVPPLHKVVGCFGRISEWKGQDVLLKAIASINAPLVLLLAGAPLFGENLVLEKLVTLAEDLGINQRVKFLGFCDDVPALMQLCDVIVHPSTLAEPFGRTIVEAMLAAKPVIASRVGGIVEILDDCETGYLVPPADVPALAKTLSRCLENPSESGTIAKQAQKTARDRFGMEKMHRSISAVLNEVLNGRIDSAG